MISKKIHLLPEHLIDQIKAGEVIERPASIIKELLENSIDAGATKIDIQLRENGLELISIEDDGHGMEFDDLPFAFCRHATSKIDRFEDIYSLNSYGFRGEALASMASIARITCSTTPLSNPEKGGKIVIHGGETKSHTPYQSNKTGTSFYIKDLFFNTPARLKFVKSKTSEKNSLKRVIHAFILSNPNVSFTLKWDDKEKEIYKAVKDKPETRAKKLIFKKNASEAEKELLQIYGKYEDYRIEGLASFSSSRGNAGKNQFLFINDRLFTDRQIHQTIIRNLEKVWGHGETGHYIIRLFAPSSEIDVNVHPNKTHVKFFKPSTLLSLISASIKRSIEDLQKDKVQNSSLLNRLSGEQNGLFNNKQSQEISLASFASNPLQENYIGQEQNDVRKESFSVVSSAGATQIIKIEENYSLLIKNEKKETFIIDHSKIVSTYIVYNMQIFSQCNEEDLTPLIISEPFEVPKKSKTDELNILRPCGFELDRLDDEIVALRTIPNYLSEFPVRDILNPLFKHISKVGLIDLNDINTFLKKDYSLESAYDFIDEVKLIFERIPLHVLLESGALAHLNKINIKRLF